GSLTTSERRDIPASVGPIRSAQIWDISNNVGCCQETSLTTSAVVKRHVHRSGRWSRLSAAYEPAEAAVPGSGGPFVVSTLSTQSVSQHHNDVAHHTSLRSRRTMMTS